MRGKRENSTGGGGDGIRGGGVGGGFGGAYGGGMAHYDDNEGLGRERGREEGEKGRGNLKT